MGHLLQHMSHLLEKIKPVATFLPHNTYINKNNTNIYQYINTNIYQYTNTNNNTNNKQINQQHQHLSNQYTNTNNMNIYQHLQIQHHQQHQHTPQQ